MSNEIPMRIRYTAHPRVPDQRCSDQGQSGPKAHPAERGKLMANGLNIPVPPGDVKLRRYAEVTLPRRDLSALKELGWSAGKSAG